MPSTTKHATLRVINDNVDLGGGTSLPKGDYDGNITVMTVSLHGHTRSQIGKVAIYLSEEFLQNIGFAARPNSTRLGLEADFTPAFLNGDIIEV